MRENTKIKKFEDFVIGLYNIKYSSLSGERSWEVISHLYKFQECDAGEEVVFSDVKINNGPCEYDTSWAIDSGVYDQTPGYYEFMYIGNEDQYPEYFI